MIEEKVKVNYSLDKTLVKLVGRVAKKVGIWKSSVVEIALTDFFEKYANLIKDEEWDILKERVLKSIR